MEVHQHDIQGSCIMWHVIKPYSKLCSAHHCVKSCEESILPPMLDIPLSTLKVIVVNIALVLHTCFSS